MKPAARVSDSTIHGGTILSGASAVLIEGLPAARVGDLTICPMTAPPPPHVGGPILPPGASMVLIEGQPAARLTDLAFCEGGGALICTGAVMVLIGD